MSTYRALLIGVTCSLWAVGAAAQELSPRAYWPAPKGTRVAVFGYMYISADVTMDPSIPIKRGDTRNNTAIVAYMHTFGFWGRTTNVLLELPYSWGRAEGLVLGEPAKRDYSGFNDFGVTMAVNLLGAPSMTVEEFQELRKNPHPILGASLKVLAPTGSYHDDRLINVGANRWAFKPELGYMHPLTPKWHLELKGGVWLFGDDDDFAPGKREQEPVYIGGVHLVRRFTPGFWTSLDYTYYEGGRQTIGGNELDDVQRNARLGGTLVVPVRPRQALKFGYSTGVKHEFGSDFDQFLVTYNVVF